LVGAVIFVALIVALVPEILSGPRQAATAGDASSSEQPLRTYTIDLAEQGFPADQPEEAIDEPAGETTQPATAAPTETVAPAPAISPRPTNRTPAPAESDAGWAVQLGSFSNADNAERLAAELRGRGYKAFVSRFESAGQPRLRVRVGPEQDRARAEQLAARLRREGRQATVVEHP
jgi:DedD protein